MGVTEDSDNARLVSSILTAAVRSVRAEGRPYRSLSVTAVRRLALDFRLPGARVEATALEAGVVPERYSRNFASFTASDQIRLLRASVTLVGVGGLGGWLAELLARAGVGTIRLVDGDRFDDSNLNRQLFCGEGVIGRLKVEVAAERLAGVNSSVTVETRCARLTDVNGVQLLAGSDVAADCLDSISTRFLLQDAAAGADVPLVSAAVAGASGRLLTILRGDAGFHAIYGKPAPNHGEEVLLGNPPHTVAFLASLQCAEIIRMLLGNPGLYQGRMLIVDLESGTFDTVALY